MSLIPCAALFKPHALTTKYVERAPNCQVDPAIAQLLHQFQVLEVAAATSVCGRDSADICQMSYELLVYACLQSLGICCMNQELAAVRLEL